MGCWEFYLLNCWITSNMPLLVIFQGYALFIHFGPICRLLQLSMIAFTCYQSTSTEPNSTTCSRNCDKKLWNLEHLQQYELPKERRVSAFLDLQLFCEISNISQILRGHPIPILDNRKLTCLKWILPERPPYHTLPPSRSHPQSKSPWCFSEIPSGQFCLNFTCFALHNHESHVWDLTCWRMIKKRIATICGSLQRLMSSSRVAILE